MRVPSHLMLPRSLARTRTQTAQNTEVDELEDKSADDNKEVKKEGVAAGSGGGGGGEGCAAQPSGVATHGVPLRVCMRARVVYLASMHACTCCVPCEYACVHVLCTKSACMCVPVRMHVRACARMRAYLFSAWHAGILCPHTPKSLRMSPRGPLSHVAMPMGARTCLVHHAHASWMGMLAVICV